MPGACCISAASSNEGSSCIIDMASPSASCINDISTTQGSGCIKQVAESRQTQSHALAASMAPAASLAAAASRQRLHQSSSHAEHHNHCSGIGGSGCIEAEAASRW